MDRTNSRDMGRWSSWHRGTATRGNATGLARGCTRDRSGCCCAEVSNDDWALSRRQRIVLYMAKENASLAVDRLEAELSTK
jgi:hypothetical protein